MTQQSQDERVDVDATPRSVVVTSLVMGGLGLAVSAYLTFEHFTSSSSLACPETSVISCVKVTASPYSRLLGVPVALLGLLFFAAMTALCAPVAWRSRSRAIERARIAGATTGVLFIVYLVWAELFGVGAICLWCTVVHILAVGLFAVVLYGAAVRTDRQ